MKINLGLSPLANVLALINTKNGSLLNETNVTAGPVSPSVDDPDDNTQITLTAVVGEGYTGERTYVYNRYDLLGGREPDPDQVEIVSTDSQAAIKTKVATAYGLKESEITISAVTPAAVGETTAATMSAVEGSLLYLGADVPITIATSSN